MDAVRVNHITKSYGSLQALSDICFEVGKGELFGIIGPDGAGKTTLFRILTTLLVADKGTACIGGLDVLKDYKEIRKRVGYMPGRFSLYQDMTVEENLSFFATVFGTTIQKNYHLIEDIYKQIEPFKNRMAGKLSGGMKQKLALSCALIHKPEILFLDEPTTGVDPVSRKEFWEMLRRLKEQGISIVVSTPYMDEASLCDRIALMRDGKFMSIDTPSGMIDSYAESLWAVSADHMSSLLHELRKDPHVTSCFAFGQVHHITVTQEFSPDLLRDILEEKGYKSVKITPVKATVEDCYMQLAKKE